MPIGLLRAFVDMMPRLQAQESLTASTRVAMGSGTLGDDASRRIHGLWRRTAEPDVQPAAPRRFVRLSPGAAEALGVRRVPVSRDADA